MSNKENNTSVIQQLTRKKAPNLLAFSLTFGCTIMVVSSVVQATDLQIYAPEAAGQKTIVLMLDTSGSMGSVDSSAKASYSNRDDFNSIYSVHDKFHRTLILSGFCLLKIAKISLNSSFFPKPIKR